MEDRRQHNEDIERVLHAFQDHAEKDDGRFNTLGTSVNEMKIKVDEMHALLVQAKAVGGFFGGIKSLAGWLLVIGALVALAKGWLAGLLAWVMIK